jgi:hypothetical protein
MSKYDRVVKGVTVDVYDVLAAWKVTNPAVQHAIKKLLQPGARVLQDLEEAGQSIERAIEIVRIEQQGLYDREIPPHPPAPVAPAWQSLVQEPAK